MTKASKQTLYRSFHSIALGVIIALGMGTSGHALGSQQNPQSGSTGIQGTISSPAPTTPATIVLPSSGQTFTSTPITVSGLCQDGLLVKIFSNNIFVGSTMCEHGSFSLKTDLFSGGNDLVARVFDSLDQAGPDSSIVKVNFQDAEFSAFGQRVSLTSRYAKLGANPGEVLKWPIILSGGSAPYAVSADWGDSTAEALKSVSFAGEFELTHTYKSAGSYRVVVKATDANGQTAFLQLVGVANGKVTQAVSSTGASAGTPTTIVQKQFVWWPYVAVPVLIVATFWIGKRYELQAIHRQLEEQTKSYNSDY